MIGRPSARSAGKQRLMATDGRPSFWASSRASRSEMPSSTDPLLSGPPSVASLEVARAMIVTHKALSRRTMLRGMGAALALPLLDSMVPALAALGKTAGRSSPRFSVVYVPNGINMPHWTPLHEEPLDVT